MSWTQVIIIAENVKEKKFDIFSRIQEEDIKLFNQDGTFFSKYKQIDNRDEVLMITYERRKTIPYWLFENISQLYPTIYFTVLGSCCYDGGPGGIVKISNGQIVDSYGIFDKRQDILSNPNPNIVFEWYKREGFEMCFRNYRLLEYPFKKFDEVNFNDTIDFSENEIKELDDLIEKNINYEWIDL